VLLGISYRSSTQCPECAQQVPVNHARARFHCSHCHATVDRLQNERAWWLGFSGEFATRYVLKRPENDVGQINTPKQHLEFFRGPAACPSCHQPMQHEALLAGAASGTFRCACGFATPCRDAEPSLVQAFPYARWLLAEGPEAGDAPNAAQPILMACMGCGAGLKVDGSSRTVDCIYCKATNYLPDGLWLRLHPAPRLEWFFLVIDIDPAALAAEQSRSSPFDDLMLKFKRPS
jgi:hypothetical protein